MFILSADSKLKVYCLGSAQPSKVWGYRRALKGTRSNFSHLLSIPEKKMLKTSFMVTSKSSETGRKNVLIFISHCYFKRMTCSHAEATGSREWGQSSLKGEYYIQARFLSHKITKTMCRQAGHKNVVRFHFLSEVAGEHLMAVIYSKSD